MSSSEKRIQILKALAFLKGQGEKDVIALGFDVLDAKLRDPATCERCKRQIPPWTACTIIVPSSPLEPPKEIVGRTKGWAFHNECFEGLGEQR